MWIMDFFRPNIKGMLKNQDVKGLINILKTNPDYTQPAVTALIKIGQPAVDLLIDALTDTSDKVRGKVIETLGAIGDSAAIKPIMGYYQYSSNNIDIIRALSKIKDTRAVEALIFIADDEDATDYLKYLVIVSLNNLKRKNKFSPEIEELIVNCKAAEEKRLLKTFPRYWAEDTAFRNLTLSIINEHSRTGEGCPYFNKGVCLFRVISKNDQLIGPEKCSLVRGGYKSCYVWATDPR